MADDRRQIRQGRPVLTAVVEDIQILPEGKAPAAKVPLSIRIGMGLGAVGDAAAAQIVAFLGIRFLTDSMAVAAAAAGLIFFIIRVYDALIDPIIGMASDRTRSSLGRRLPYLIVGAIVVPLTTAWVFNAPHLSSPLYTALMLTVILMAYGTAQSLWRVPYYAMAVEVSSDYHGRSSVMAARVAGGSIGQMLGSTLPTWLLVYWGHDSASYGRMSWVVAGVTFVCLAGAIVMLRKAAATTPIKSDHRIFDQLKIAWRNKPFRILALTHICFLVGVTTVSASNAFFSRDVLQRTDLWLGYFYIVLIAANLISMPFWTRIAKKVDKKLAYQVSLAGYGLMHLTWMLAGPQETMTVSLARVFVIGLFMGGVVLMAYSTLADAIRYDFVLSGLRREGTFSGAMTLIDKFAGAGGLALMGWILAFTGYVSSTTGGQGLKSQEVLMGIYLNFSIIPAVTALLSILLLAGYRLNQTDLKEDVD